MQREPRLWAVSGGRYSYGPPRLCSGASSTRDHEPPTLNLIYFGFTGTRGHSILRTRASRANATTFDAIASTPGIHLRLGHIRRRQPKWHYPLKRALESVGVDLAKFEEVFKFRSDIYQRDVDTLIVLDLVRLAERHAYDTAVLVAEDRDLARLSAQHWHYGPEVLRFLRENHHSSRRETFASTPGRVSFVRYPIGPDHNPDCVVCKAYPPSAADWAAGENRGPFGE
jgi:hypothetical protein